MLLNSCSLNTAVKSFYFFPLVFVVLPLQNITESKQAADTVRHPPYLFLRLKSNLCAWASVMSVCVSVRLHTAGVWPCGLVAESLRLSIQLFKLISLDYTFILRCKREWCTFEQENISYELAKSTKCSKNCVLLHVYIVELMLSGVCGVGSFAISGRASSSPRLR